MVNYKLMNNIFSYVTHYRAVSDKRSASAFFYNKDAGA